MTVARFPDDAAPAEWRQPVVALGNFDGLHRGHKRIIDRVCRHARERHGTALVLTFNPHPPRVVRPDRAPPLLMTLDQRIEALVQAGLDGVAIVAFTPELARWSPERFVETVLVEWLHVAEVWVGSNFLFGRDRSGNFSVLRTLGQQHGFAVEKIDPVRYKDFVVSSTRIRRLLSDGRVDEAAALMGHVHFVDGHVVEGDKRGRTIGFPTANLETANELVPPNGVYATLVRADGVLHPSVTNIGVRPTVSASGRRTIEAHLLDGDHELYDRVVRLFFVQRLRDERTFDSLDALVARIREDVGEARALFSRLSL